mmetsp:Transcript_13754/g.23873  ORF Transcript_13754/g.23873 Transcript_13754/m.23873 type:complete len:101 (+) Transcript_13754:494-796(+)
MDYSTQYSTTVCRLILPPLHNHHRNQKSTAARNHGPTSMDKHGHIHTSFTYRYEQTVAKGMKTSSVTPSLLKHHVPSSKSGEGIQFRQKFLRYASANLAM